MDLEGCTVVAYLNKEGFSELRNLVGLPDKDAGLPAVVTAADRFGLLVVRRRGPVDTHHRDAVALSLCRRA
jgi:hypothetical protein